MADDGVVWELAGKYGQERWRQVAGKFSSVEIGTRHIDQADFGDEWDLLALRKSTCGCAEYWPSAFEFCPECGKPAGPRLATAASEDAGENPRVWVPPFGTVAGLPEWDANAPAKAIALAKVPGDEKLPVEDVEIKGTDLNFVVGGSPSRLYAIDRKQGTVYRWLQQPDALPADGSWAECSRIDRIFKLPNWSWAAAVTAKGFAVPTDEGPVWLQASPSAPFTACKPEKNLGIRACVAGAAGLDQDVLVPVRTDAGLAVATYSEQSGSWTVLTVTNGDKCADDAYLSAPVIFGHDIFWTGVAGYLCVTGSLATYVPWENGFVAECGFRPYQDTSGMLFQLGHSDELCYTSLAPAGGLLETRVGDGYAISAGQSVFRESRRFDSPWVSAYTEEFRLGDGEFILPLLIFRGEALLFAACSGRRTLPTFFSVDKPGEERRCALTLGAATYQSVGFPVVTRIRSAWDLATFVYRGAVFIYSRSDNKCWCWNAGLG